MEIRLDHEANAAYISLRKGKVFRTKDMGGGYILDYNRLGKVLGIEILNLSQKAGVKGLESTDVTVPPRIWKLAQ